MTCLSRASDILSNLKDLIRPIFLQQAVPEARTYRLMIKGKHIGYADLRKLQEDFLAFVQSGSVAHVEASSNNKDTEAFLYAWGTCAETPDLQILIHVCIGNK